MNRDCFRLSEDQFARLQPLLLTDTLGKPRVDDRRVISGIVKVLKPGGSWVIAPSLRTAQDALQPLRPMVGRGRLGRHLPRPSLGRRAAGQGADRLLHRQGASLRLRRQRGGSQAIGRSRGGRATKIHALTDGLCRPIAFLLTGGQVGDCTAGDLLLEQMPASPILLADKGYDSNAIRHKVEGKGTMPNISPRANRRWKNCFSPFLYRDRNAIERIVGRLKDRRRMHRRNRQLLVMGPEPKAMNVPLL